MTIQLTIPEATRRLTLDLPEPVPAGTVDVILSFPAMERRQAEDDLDETIEELWELCKDVPISADSFLEERHAEAEREEAKYRA